MLKIERLSPVIGAEVSGANLISPNDDEFKELEQALSEYSVLFFRDQPRLSPKQQVAFATQFGPLHSHPAAPVLEDDEAIFVIKTDANSKVANGNGWHTDVSCDNEPPLVTMLQLHQLPETGGDTLFSSMYAAYETLSKNENISCRPRCKPRIRACLSGQVFGSRRRGQNRIP